MISVDTNLLFFALAEDRPEHAHARAFVEHLSEAGNVVLSEFVLVELYRLLRNPAVVKTPLKAKEAVDIINLWRAHPRWRIAGFSREDEGVHDQLWRIAAQSGFAFRRIFDARLALVLRQHGVTDFATANVKDFHGFGFARVWNPLA